MVPTSSRRPSREVDQVCSINEAFANHDKTDHLPELIQSRPTTQNLVSPFKRKRACASTDPQPGPNKPAAEDSSGRDRCQRRAAATPLQKTQNVHPSQLACAEDFGSPSSDHLSSSFGLFTMLRPQRPRAVDAQPKQPCSDINVEKQRPTKRLKQMASQDKHKSIRCDARGQFQKSEAPKGKEGKQTQVGTPMNGSPYNFRSREVAPRSQWKYSPKNEGLSTRKKTVEWTAAKGRRSRPGKPCEDFKLENHMFLVCTLTESTVC